MISIEPSTIVLFADTGCPWAHVCVHRLHRKRAELGLEDRVRFDLRAFPLEVFNRQPTPKKVLDAEIPVAGALEPEAGWAMWQGPEHAYPVTMLPALEAVQAAKEQGLRASEELDRALRIAFFGAGRNVSMRHEILAVAEHLAAVDENHLAEALDAGRARPAVMEQCSQSEGDVVKGSPHVFMPDGSDVHNPGIDLEWHGEHGKGFPVVKSDDPSVYEDIFARASAG